MNRYRRVALHNSVWAALFTGLIAVGAFLSIPLPISPVPIVLQNLFVLLAGLMLGWRWGAVAVSLYLLLGIVGLPVFSQARGGLAHIAGPTGGYLLGFLPSVILTGFIAGRQRSMVRYIVAVVVGSLTIYVCGVPWLKAISGLSWSRAIALGMVPFIPGDAIKAVVAIAVARMLSRRRY